MDSHFAFFANQIFSSATMQHFVALINSRYGDWSFEFFSLLLFFFGLKEPSKKKRVAMMLVIIVTLFLTVFFINKGILKKFPIERASPSITLNLPNQYENFSYPHNRVTSLHSFPSDRATVVLSLIFIAYPLLTYKAFALLILPSVAMLVTRLIVGAHWLTDLIFGSLPLSIFLFFLSNYIIKKIYGHTKQLAK